MLELNLNCFSPIAFVTAVALLGCIVGNKGFMISSQVLAAAPDMFDDTVLYQETPIAIYI